MGRISKEAVQKILSQCKRPPQIYVETGLYNGAQIKIAADTKRFKKIIGIELDPRFAAACQRLVPTATIHCGDTRSLLPPLARKLKEPVFWYLDAHYCATDPPIAKSAFPLWDELVSLRTRPPGDVIVIDDVHCFGKPRPDLLFRKSVPEWEGVTRTSIASFLGAAGEVIGDGYVVWR